MKTYSQTGAIRFEPSRNTEISIKQTFFRLGSDGYGYTKDVLGDGKWYRIIIKTQDGSKFLDIDESNPLDDPEDANIIRTGTDGNSYIKYGSNWYLILVKSSDGSLFLDIDESSPYSSLP